MEQLHVTSYFDPTDDSAVLGNGDLWGDPETPESLERWVREVEVQPSFSAAMNMKPTAVRVEQEQV
jgi:hypothetical protein